MTPDTRIRAQNERGIDVAGSYVLYWMIAARRTRFKFGLQRAVEAANELGKPLLQANARACADSAARYVPDVEPSPGDGRCLLDALAARAALVVTDWDATSHLSPYLHFGHISPYEVFSAVMSQERWTTRKLAGGASGQREGWWHVSVGAEQFLDQLTVWRELAFNGATWTPGFGSFDALPAWARATLDAHRADEREHVCSRAQLDAARTHDPVWNAAQNELRETGWFHGYMRMVWGKKILEWSRRPEDALAHMAAPMDTYSLDGRDPVSLLNYSWVLGGSTVRGSNARSSAPSVT